jgi:two-component system LytT family response regulator
MKILAVDDETLALSRLKRLLGEIGFKDIIATDNPFEALEYISKEPIDVAFLDITMPQMDGLELASKIRDIAPNIFIVFQTAYSEHALDAFRSGGIDYILKPISKESIKASIERVQKYTPSATDEKKILAKAGDDIYLIDSEDIFYIQADLDEVIIRIQSDFAYVRKKMGDLELALKSKNFFRIHRSYIVNVDKIKSMRSVEQSKLEIQFDGIDDVIASSKDGAKEFRDYLERKTL